MKSIPFEGTVQVFQLSVSLTFESYFSYANASSLNLLDSSQKTFIKTVAKFYSKYALVSRMFHVIGPCTWDSQKSPAVLCTCPCLHPCTSLSRSLLPRSSWRLRPQTCTSVPQSSSQQKIYLWNSVMYELLVSLIKTKATVCSCFPHVFWHIPSH